MYKQVTASPLKIVFFWRDEVDCLHHVIVQLPTNWVKSIVRTRPADWPRQSITNAFPRFLYCEWARAACMNSLLLWIPVWLRSGWCDPCSAIQCGRVAKINHCQGSLVWQNGRIHLHNWCRPQQRRNGSLEVSVIGVKQRQAKRRLLISLNLHMISY